MITEPARLARHCAVIATLAWLASVGLPPAQTPPQAPSAQPSGQAPNPAAAPATAPQAPTENDLALITAAGKGDLDGVAKAMRAGASIRARDARGRNAVLAAAYGNHVPVALLLMAAGSDVNAKDDQ